MTYNKNNININFNDYLKLLWNYKKYLLNSTLIISILTIIISLIMPKTYTSSALIMPPMSRSGLEGGGLLGALTEMPLTELLLRPDDETLNFIAILKSRTTMEDVIKNYDLIKFYKSDNIEAAIEKLTDHSDFFVEPEGTIRIICSVSTKWFHLKDDEEYAKKLSADITNYYINKLDDINSRLKSKEASFHRMFIEKRYNENVIDLHVAENNLKTFQKEYKMISLEEQALASIELAASVRAQLLSTEIEYGIAKKILNPDHHEIDLFEKKIDELKNQLNKMNFGLDEKLENDYFPIISDVPDLTFKFGRLTRDVLIQNTLFTFLTQEYEQAKIQEAKDSPTVLVLDRAYIPYERTSPKRLFILIVTFFSTLILSCIIIYLIELNKLNRIK